MQPGLGSRVSTCRPAHGPHLGRLCEPGSRAESRAESGQPVIRAGSARPAGLFSKRIREPARARGGWRTAALWPLKRLPVTGSRGAVPKNGSNPGRPEPDGRVAFARGARPRAVSRGHCVRRRLRLPPLAGGGVCRRCARYHGLVQGEPRARSGGRARLPSPSESCGAPQQLALRAQAAMLRQGPAVWLTRGRRNDLREDTHSHHC